MTKLSEEQREFLAELLESETWPAMLTFCQILVEQAEIRVLTSDITKSDRDIVLLKAKLEATRDMHKSIYNLRDHVGIRKKK